MSHLGGSRRGGARPISEGWLRAAGGRRDHEAPRTNMTRLNLVATTGPKKKRHRFAVTLGLQENISRYPSLGREAAGHVGPSVTFSGGGGTRVHSESSAAVCCLAALSGHISPTPADEVYCAAPRRGCRVAPGKLWQRRRRKAGRATFTIRRS